MYREQTHAHREERERGREGDRGREKRGRESKREGESANEEPNTNHKQETGSFFVNAYTHNTLGKAAHDIDMNITWT